MEADVKERSYGTTEYGCLTHEDKQDIMSHKEAESQRPRKREI